jgi:hypothetical protein
LWRSAVYAELIPLLGILKLDTIPLELTHRVKEVIPNVSFGHPHRFRS